MDKNAWFMEKIRSVHNDKYSYPNLSYQNYNSKIKIQCPFHGIFTQIAGNHLSGRGCFECGIESKRNRFKKKLDQFIKESRVVHGHKYSYQKVNYTNSKTKIIIICPNHGEFKQTPISHLKGCGCQKCGRESISKKRKLTLKEFITRANKTHNNKYDYTLSEYIDCHTPVTIICPIHGSFEQKPANHVNKNGCHKCKSVAISESKQYSPNDFEKLANKIHNKKYQYYNDYIDSKTKIKIRCELHGSFYQVPNCHLAGSGCPKCSTNINNIELKIQNFLDLFNIDYLINDRKTIPPLELDCLIKNKNLAIEINGIYWHSELLGKDKNYHLNKTKLCAQKGVRLIHIFESELKHKKQIVISRLKNILSKTKYSIYARKCSVSEVSKNVKSKFLNKYHIQGSDKSSIHLGLFLRNRLVSVMTFSKNRKTLGKQHISGEWELSRYASIRNFNIVGGAGKLLKYFERNFDPKKITSYADLRWSNGNLYKQLGFTKLHESKPNYWYFKNNDMTLYNRFKFKKSELPRLLENFDPSLTEWENMQNNGWNRIWDCGSIVFEKSY